MPFIKGTASTICLVFPELGSLIRHQSKRNVQNWLQGVGVVERCSMTGNIINDPSDGIWDDGEWISWEWINQQIYQQELKDKYPDVSVELIQIFEELVETADSYKQITGRYLPVFGELGELFAEITFGIKRHKPRAQGSDGRLGNDFVEVKTITPEKRSQKVVVRRKGHFNKLVVVRISDNFEFEARMMDRKHISKGTGKLATVTWSSMQSKQGTKNPK